MSSFNIVTYFISAWLMVGVLAQTVQQDYTVKMVGCEQTESVYAGRLEMLYLNTWGTICGDIFDNKAASVACYSLGYQRGRAIYVHNEYGGPPDKKIILRGLNCTGQETHLDGCQHPPFNGNGYPPTICTHDQDVYVACESYKYQNGNDVLGYQIKLCNTTFNCTSEIETEGLLQVKYNGVWGTVCGTSDAFDYEELKVTCRTVLRHLSEDIYFIYGNYTAYDAEFDPPPYTAADNVPIWLGGVECDGSERNIGSCKHPAWGVDTCHHYNDVWIKCSARLKSTGAMLSGEELKAAIKEGSEKKNKKSLRYQKSINNENAEMI